jgi:hypothetical protein
MRQFQRATGRFRKGTTTKECLREPESRDGWTRKGASVEMLRGRQKKKCPAFFFCSGGAGKRAKKKLKNPSCDGQGNVKADPSYGQIRAGAEKRRMNVDERCYKPDVTMLRRRCKKPRFHGGRCTKTPFATGDDNDDDTPTTQTDGNSGIVVWSSSRLRGETGSSHSPNPQRPTQPPPAAWPAEQSSGI